MTRQIVNALVRFTPQLVQHDLTMKVDIKLAPEVETSMWLDMDRAKAMFKVMEFDNLDATIPIRLLLEIADQSARVLAFIDLLDDNTLYMIAEPVEETPEPVDDPGEDPKEESIEDIIEQGQVGLDDVLEGDE